MSKGRIEDAAKAAYVAHLQWRVNDGWGYAPDWDHESASVHHYWVKVAEAVLASETTPPEPIVGIADIYHEPRP